MQMSDTEQPSVPEEPHSETIVDFLSVIAAATEEPAESIESITTETTHNPEQELPLIRLTVVPEHDQSLMADIQVKPAMKTPHSDNHQGYIVTAKLNAFNGDSMPPHRLTWKHELEWGELGMEFIDDEVTLFDQTFKSESIQTLSEAMNQAKIVLESIR